MGYDGKCVRHADGGKCVHPPRDGPLCETPASSRKRPHGVPAPRYLRRLPSPGGRGRRAAAVAAAQQAIRILRELRRLIRPTGCVKCVGTTEPARAFTAPGTLADLASQTRMYAAPPTESRRTGPQSTSLLTTLLTACAPRPGPRVAATRAWGATGLQRASPRGSARGPRTRSSPRGRQPPAGGPAGAAGAGGSPCLPRASPSSADGRLTGTGAGSRAAPSGYRRRAFPPIVRQRATWTPATPASARSRSWRRPRCRGVRVRGRTRRAGPPRA